MNMIVSGIVRSLLSNFMILLLLLSLSTPRWGKKAMTVWIAMVMAIDLITSIIFYCYGDLTTLAKLDIPFIVVFGVLGIFLFREKTMQWLFNFTTAMNVYFIVVFLSYVLSRNFPYPVYANILLRVILFAIAVALFWHYVRPLYRQVAEQWNIFFMVVVGILINFGTYIILCKDITKMMFEQMVPLLCLIGLAALIYTSIFHSLKNLIRQKAMQDESAQTQMERTMMELSFQTMETQIALMEKHHQLNRENMEQVRHLRHDMKYQLTTLKTLLAQSKVSEAQHYLEEISDDLPMEVISDKNSVTESFLTKYRRMCQDRDIEFQTDITYDEACLAHKVNYGVILGNALQNAYEAAMGVKAGRRYISVQGRQVQEQLLLVIENSFNGVINPDYASTKEGEYRGYGIKSIQSIVEQNAGYMEITYSDCCFCLCVAMHTSAAEESNCSV